MELYSSSMALVKEGFTDARDCLKSSAFYETRVIYECKSKGISINPSIGKFNPWQQVLGRVGSVHLQQVPGMEQLDR